METLEEIIDRIEEVTLPELRDELRLLEFGGMRTAKSVGFEPWEDTTLSEIARLEFSIQLYEKMVTELRKAQAQTVSALLRQPR
jgi:hypothetical protein